MWRMTCFNSLRPPSVGISLEDFTWHLRAFSSGGQESYFANVENLQTVILVQPQEDSIL
jgi:hypothetical protein